MGTNHWPLRMSVGVGARLGSTTSFEGLLGEVRTAAADGVGRVWLAHVPWGQDSLTLITAVGREVPAVEFGTSVIATYPRHPAALAQQALTVDAVLGGRLSIGVGTSHKHVIEPYYGYSFDRPAEHTRNFLGTFVPLLSDRLAPKGDGRPMDMHMDVPGAGAPPVYLAALGPRMLAIAGELTRGTITWFCGPKVLREHVRPRLDEAAAAAGRPRPEVVCALPICVTDDASGARGRIAEHYAMYTKPASYRAALDRGGATGPADVAIVGTEAQVSTALMDLASSGADEFLAVEFGTDAELERTRRLLLDGP